MTGMTTSLSWGDIALRLALTVLVGVLIGYNRTEQGKAAGMRTVLLVCLAASVAMIQVNLLLPMAGRPAGSFVMNDLMRLPLGILTGVGFIGGGAILRRDNLVVGVTTAATLWLVTVIGLCIGGGQIVLGLAATALGMFALWGMSWIEHNLKSEHRARLTLDLEANGPSEGDIRKKLREAGQSVVASRLLLDRPGKQRRLAFELREMRRHPHERAPAFVDELGKVPGVARLQWQELA
jgi:putative Mg2+ transporter-C (MgtC) family protein